MIAFRSAAFAVLALLWTTALCIAFVPFLATPRRHTQRAAAVWCRGLITLVRWCCNIDWQVDGRENLPRGAALLAAKHQSAWETLIFYILLDDPVFVLKRELLNVPLLGWYLKKTGNIAIDRSAGFRAMKTLLPGVEAALAEGAQVIVFPEGTRSPPGVHTPYHPGIAALYARMNVPVTPVALNSGLFWGRKRFLKFPGTITIEFLPPIPPGLERAGFLGELELQIEEASTRLCALPYGTAASACSTPPQTPPSSSPMETMADGIDDGRIH
ncbi:MAG: 1-acyl-sn-glycerol-3-phosphate acyltransferase [Rhodospirillales bacterium]|nr:1-acyl-sn-glycerol-3-phosphate acyltransferase [Rhodospirillales bacterium]